MICGGSISGKSASGRPDIAINPVDHSQNRNHNRNDRTFDKEIRDHLIYSLFLCVTSAFSASLRFTVVSHRRGTEDTEVTQRYFQSLLTNGFGDTVIPGLTFNVPSATIDSPGFRPSSTIHIDPLFSPSFTARMLI